MRKFLKVLQSAYSFIGLNSAAKGTVVSLLDVVIKSPYTLAKTLYHWIWRTKKKSLGVDLPIFEADKSLVIAVLMTGGLGDHIVSARFLRDLVKAVPELLVDVYSTKPSVAQFVLGGQSFVRKVYAHAGVWEAAHQKYVLAFWLTQFAKVVNFQRSEFLNNYQDRYPDLIPIIQNLLAYQERFQKFIDKQPFLDGAGAFTLGFLGFDRYSLHKYAKIPSEGDLFDLPTEQPEELWLSVLSLPYITVNTGFDEQMGSSSTKAYPHMETLIDMLRRESPHLGIVQIGVSSSARLSGATLDLVGKTSLKQCVGILKGAALHIDTEGGLVHMATSVGTKACVLFGPTPVDFFGYPQNLNIGPAECGACFWSEPSWMTQCPRGFGVPPCLGHVSPAAVLGKITEALDSDIGAHAVRIPPPAI